MIDARFVTDTMKVVADTPRAEFEEMCERIATDETYMLVVRMSTPPGTEKEAFVIISGRYDSENNTATLLAECGFHFLSDGSILRAEQQMFNFELGEYEPIYISNYQLNVANLPFK